MKPDITSSLVTYHNDPAILKKVISSFLNTSLNVQLIISDNSATPAIETLAEDPRCEYVFNNANLGFGAAHNKGIKSILDKSRYHLILNPDVTFPAGTLEVLYNFMENNPDVGLVMPKVLDFHGEMQYLCKTLPSPTDLIVRRFVYTIFPNLFKKRMTRYQMLDRDYNKSFEAPSLSGCFMLLRVDALKKAGLFDERYFMYMEDIDLSRRVHQHYKTVYYPNVYIYHGHARESYRLNKLLFTHIRSAFKYFNKWGWFFDAERRKVNRSL